MVYKFTDTMAALISNVFTLWFILFDRLVAYFLQLRFVTLQYAVTTSKSMIQPVTRQQGQVGPPLVMHRCNLCCHIAFKISLKLTLVEALS